MVRACLHEVERYRVLHRICKTISVLYSLLYGRESLAPVHSFEFLCLYCFANSVSST